jgi:uncharacterized protein (TIGR03435 family)
MNQSLKRCLITLTLTAALAPAQISRPAFDVASIKLNTHCDASGPSGGTSTPGRIAMECADLRDLILTAYGIYGNGANPAPGSFRMQVTGGPAWMDSARYDIIAKPAGNPLRSEMYGPMLQSLLEDRFKLKVHRETKEGRVYLLTLAKNGPKLRATKEGTCVLADINHPPEAGGAHIPVCGKPRIGSGGPVVTVDIPGATIANLCAQLGMVMDREVMDRTGIAGRFDIHFEATPADLQRKFVAGRTIERQDQVAGDDPDSGPSISAALEQQLGLKLDTGSGPVQAIVVDHIERPTGN